MSAPTGLDIAYASTQTAITMLRPTIRGSSETLAALDALAAAPAHAMELAYLRTRAPANATTQDSLAAWRPLPSRPGLPPGAAI